MVLVLGIAAIVTLNLLTNTLLFFSILQGLLALWLLYRAWKTNTGKARSVAYTTIIAVWITLDLGIGMEFRLVGILPPLYLFFAWIQENIHRSFVTGFPKIAGTLGALKLPKLILNHPTTSLLFLPLCLEGVNLGLAYVCLYLVGYQVYMAATGVPFGLYGCDKIVIAFRERKHRAVWMVYLAVFGASQVLDWYTGTTFPVECGDGDTCENDGFFGWTALCSALFLTYFHYRVKIRAFWRSSLRRRQPGLATNNDLESR
jgi:hypothetical protein